MAHDHIIPERIPVVEVRGDVDDDVPLPAVHRGAVVEHEAHDTVRVLRAEGEVGDVGAHAEGHRRLVEVLLPPEVRVRLVEPERELGGLVADVLDWFGGPGVLWHNEGQG